MTSNSLNCPYYFFDQHTLESATPNMHYLVDALFPVEHYGEDILTFEGWGLRAILKQAMVMGRWCTLNDFPDMNARIIELKKNIGEVTASRDMLSNRLEEVSTERFHLKNKVKELEEKIWDLEKSSACSHCGFQDEHGCDSCSYNKNPKHGV